MTRHDLGTAIAQAQHAQARPRTLDELTLSVRDLDRRELQDHRRLTPWRDVKPDAADLEASRRLGRELLRLRTCDAVSLDSGRREAVWVYEWLSGEGAAQR